MIVRITCFSIDWYNCGCCCVDDNVHERITIYENGSKIKIKQFNGRREVIEEMEYKVPGEKIWEFFSFIHNTMMLRKWNDDYRVEVCDGSEWEMRIKYSDRTVTCIKGTVEKPPLGAEIEKLINQMLESTCCLYEPILFGC